jgi:dipeptidyl aminopeptidase/acylaminoacyl peptidase
MLGRKEVGKATERSHNRALARFVGLGVVLALVLLLTSVTSPPVSQAAFPGTNGKIAFNYTIPGNTEVYVMEADGSSPTNLSNNSAHDGTADWSPDGTKITFSSNRQDNREEVWVMDADGSNPIRLTTQNGSTSAWSPDGSKITFHSTRDGNAEIYVMNADGSDQTRLTYIAGDDAHPSWSPDGSKTAFSSMRDDNWEIYVMEADGSNPTRLTTTTEGTDWVPDWSPDGAKIAFVSDRDGDFEIYVMNADGSNQTRLTFNASDDRNPAWSPDGTKILFDSDRNGDRDIYVMEADGSNPTNLTDNSTDECCASWQPVPIIPYDFSGFFPPVDNPPALNGVKAGRAIPIKFSLNGDQGLDIFDAGFPVSQPIDCDASDPLEEVEETVTAGSSSLSYDATADQYVYVWKTDKGWAGTCRQLIVQLNDGIPHVAYFDFAK